MVEKKLIPHSKPSIDSNDEIAVLDVLRSAHLEEGVVVGKLENSFRKAYKRTHALGVSTGFAAIQLSLMALSVKAGDEIILPSYTCSALLNPVRILGATPVIVDVEPNSFNLSVEEVSKHLSRNTRAIIVPHIFGFPARIDKVKAFGTPVIEDCAQSIGGRYKGISLGNFGDLSVFSFYASKMITSGDGGMIITDKDSYKEIISNYRYYGHKKLHKYPAYNYHLTNLPASLAISQFNRLESFILRRKAIARIYDDHFAGVQGIHTNFDNKAEACYYRYPVQLDANIEGIKNKMREKGVQCGYGVLDGMHQIMDLSPDNFPNTEKLLSSILSLPIYPTLEDEDITFIAETLIKILKK